MKRLAAGAGIGVVVLLLATQAVDYGRDHANPPVRREPAWDSARTRELAVRACYDCHSNQTVWPWYASVVPASWLIQRDVDVGRRKLNFSEWDRVQKEVWESSKTVRRGEMPPAYYTVPQPHTRLSAAERRALAEGFDATFGTKRTRGGAGFTGQGESD
ncbi:MAG: heme-binding domain-containing protein [candidate division NC10 bacterium]